MRPSACASATRPKVLFVGPTPPPYQGVAVATDCLLHSSLADDFQLIHLDTSDRRPMDNSEHLDFMNVYLALVHGLRFCTLLITKRPSIVYVPIAQNTLGFLRDSLFMLPARWRGARLVIHLHGGGFAQFYRSANFLTRLFLRWCLSRVDLAIVLHDKFRNIFGGLVPASRIAVVENGIVDEFATVSRIRDRPRSERLRVLFLATLVESKGFVDLLHAAPAVLREIPDVEFVFVGDGTGFPESENARAWAAERGLQDQVKFVGPKWGHEKYQALLEADVLAFPTWYPYEGQPIVVIEAMAAGLPIVTTRHAAIANTLGEGGAVYARPRDADDLALQLIKLLKDPILRGAMGRRNRLRFLESYTVDKFATNLAATFNQVLGITPEMPGRILQASGQS
jgi:glycosyltransferase involved in cell wall biosynthesis